MAPVARFKYAKSSIQTISDNINSILSKLKNENNSIGTRLNDLKSQLKRRKKRISSRNDLRLKINQLEDRINEAENQQKKCIHSIKYYTFCNNIASSDPSSNRLWFLQSDRCPVCFDDFKIKIKLNHCQHLLCEDCLQSLLERDPESRCPKCRSDIVSYESFDPVMMASEYKVNTLGQRPRRPIVPAEIYRVLRMTDEQILNFQYLINLL